MWPGRVVTLGLNIASKVWFASSRCLWRQSGQMKASNWEISTFHQPSWRRLFPKPWLQYKVLQKDRADYKYVVICSLCIFPFQITGVTWHRRVYSFLLLQEGTDTSVSTFTSSVFSPLTKHCTFKCQPHWQSGSSSPTTFLPFSTSPLASTRLYFQSSTEQK